jgi:Holliday junction resolvasome RuvABC endonuclease subunit
LQVTTLGHREFQPEEALQTVVGNGEALIKSVVELVAVVEEVVQGAREED